MSRSGVLFYLFAANAAAREVVEDPDNQYLVVNSGARGPCFAIGNFQSKCGRRETLVTIGRTGDILLRSTTFSRQQCSFEINLDSNVIMFRDDSTSGTSDVHGENSTPFLADRPRRVVVQRGLNEYIGMGGDGMRRVEFMVHWEHPPSEIMRMVESRDVRSLAVNPRLARTDSGNSVTGTADNP